MQEKGGASGLYSSAGGLYPSSSLHFQNVGFSLSQITFQALKISKTRSLTSKISFQDSYISKTRSLTSKSCQNIISRSQNFKNKIFLRVFGHFLCTFHCPLIQKFTTANKSSYYFQNKLHFLF